MDEIFVCKSGSIPTDEEYHLIARNLFKKLPMVRAFDCDYEEALKVLKAVFNAGRVRGVVETANGPSC